MKREKQQTSLVVRISYLVKEMREDFLHEQRATNHERRFTSDKQRATD
ncbi:MAG: hypothetical protein NPIRA02_19020 [Nitrospirales bacterium]|nr:MAG: hypothetical protein NPIRA02_19020 [Nitrospirales bacterium]